jgi:Zn-dependent protease
LLGSLSIGRIAGIPIRIHWLWIAVVLGVATFWPEDKSPLGAVVSFVGMFGLVVLHELGHSLVARRYGIRVLDILLWPLGGMARMADIPESPKIEALVALAGPAVNLALAIAGGAAWLAFRALGLDAAFPGLAPHADEIAAVFVFVNLLMCFFNLLPAFPMDGGRVLRAFFATFTDWLTATRLAVTVGKGLAIVMVAAGLLLAAWDVAGSLMLPLIGGFVWITGTREVRTVRRRHGDLPGEDPTGARATTYRVERPDEPASPPKLEPAAPPPTAARRPQGNPLEHFDGRLTDEDLERLAQFRGRLRPFHDDDR